MWDNNRETVTGHKNDNCIIKYTAFKTPLSFDSRTLVKHCPILIISVDIFLKYERRLMKDEGVFKHGVYLILQLLRLHVLSQ